MPANRTASLVAREGLGGPYVLLTFLHPETAREARPGQFVMIKAGVSAEPPLRRPFSILETSPERETFTLFIKLIGQGSKALASLPIGGFAQCLGPLGRPFSLPADDTEALMVGGGYGVAPFSFLGGELLRRGGRQPRLFYGGRADGRPAAAGAACARRASRWCRPPRTARPASREGSRFRSKRTSTPAPVRAGSTPAAPRR